MTRIARSAALLALAFLTAFAIAGPAAAKPKPRDNGADAAKVLPKQWSKRHKVKGAKADPDHDGLTNWGEYRSRTKPKRADSDRDGTGDAEEDRDRDGLANAAEVRTDHDPRDPDSDGDGIRDGAENAGVVAAYDGTTLTIALAVGGSLTAAVDPGSDLACDDADLPDEDGDDEWDEGEDAEYVGDDTDISASLPEQGDEDDPDDEQWDEDELAGCGADIAPGTVVHEAEVEHGVLVALELR